MPVRPIRYGPRQYPPKYRPLGYAAFEPPPPAEPRLTAPRRRRLGLLLALLLATLAMHVGIATAYLGSDGSEMSATSSTEVENGESCGAGNTEEDLEGQSGADEGGSNSGGQDQGQNAERQLL